MAKKQFTIAGGSVGLDQPVVTTVTTDMGGNPAVLLVDGSFDPIQTHAAVDALYKSYMQQGVPYV